MFTVEFAISSILMAFLINIISGFVLQKTIEKPGKFHDKSMERLKKRLELLGGLYGNTTKLLCFSFRGIGMAVALPALTMTFLTFNNIALSYKTITYASKSLPEEPPCINKEIKYRKDGPSPECLEKILNAKMEMTNRLEDQRKHVIQRSEMAIFLFSLALIVAGIAVIYSINIYKTLKFVENYEALQAQYKEIAKNT